VKQCLAVLIKGMKNKHKLVKINIHSSHSIRHKLTFSSSSSLRRDAVVGGLFSRLFMGQRVSSFVIEGMESKQKLVIVNIHSSHSFRHQLTISSLSSLLSDADFGCLFFLSLLGDRCFFLCNKGSEE
jgi:hypothetical protein